MKVYQVEHFAWPYSIHYQIYGYLTFFFSALHQLDLQLIFIQANWYYIQIYLRRTDISFCGVKNRKLYQCPLVYHSNGSHSRISYKCFSTRKLIHMNEHIFSRLFPFLLCFIFLSCIFKHHFIMDLMLLIIRFSDFM